MLGAALAFGLATAASAGIAPAPVGKTESLVSKVAEGSYKASSQGYEGPLEVTVAVAGGKITSVKVTNNRELRIRGAIEVSVKLLHVFKSHGLDRFDLLLGRHHVSWVGLGPGV